METLWGHTVRPRCHPGPSVNQLQGYWPERQVLLFQSGGEPRLPAVWAPRSLFTFPGRPAGLGVDPLGWPPDRPPGGTTAGCLGGRAGGAKGLRSRRRRGSSSPGKPTRARGGGSRRGLQGPVPRRAGARPIGRRARRARSQATWREARRPAAPDARLRAGDPPARAARGPAARR